MKEEEYKEWKLKQKTQLFQLRMERTLTADEYRIALEELDMLDRKPQ